MTACGQHSARSATEGTVTPPSRWPLSPLPPGQTVLFHSLRILLSTVHIYPRLPGRPWVLESRAWLLYIQ